ncbi:MAG: TerD family protein [Ruminococcus sp.]|nr:TerD family protein [Ruminococcus sp.]
MGFNDGFNDLIKSYGKDSINLSPPQPVTEKTAETTPPPQKINLQKGQKISLVKCGNNIKGEISINLNWKQQTGFTAKPVDLDLGCLYELKDGSKGTIQALGNRFGSLNQPPYIMLDGDDRTGASSDGETLRINAEMVSEIKRILVYAFIYDGSADWQGTDGVVTVKCAGSPEVVVKMDEYGSNLTLCAVALLENVSDNFTVKKVVEFYKNQVYADNAFNWGLKWKAGKKD